MNFILPTTLLAALFSLTGCGQDYSLAPPKNSEYITVTVKVPEQLVARTLQVMYRSAICKHITHGASGQRIELEGYHGIDLQLQRKGQTDLYEMQLPTDGGGSCQWHLSNVVFGVVYASTARFGKGVTYGGGGGGVIVMLDHNRPSRTSGLPVRIDGDLTVVKDYYPWLSESFVSSYKKYISLASEGDNYLMYQALQARNIYFEPILHPDFVVHSAGPKVKKDGNYTSITYPDGSFVADGRHGPNFQKLQTIRLNAEAKQ